MKIKITALILPFWAWGISSSDAQSYCIPSYTETCPTDFEDFHNIHSAVFKDDVSAVLYSHLNSSCGVSNAAGTYSDFSGTPVVQLSQGKSYSLDISTESGYGNFYYAVWIDFNEDGDFEDAGELVGYTSSGSMLATWNVPFLIPADALNGIRRMRVRSAQNIAVTNPCTIMGTAGEVHDYSVVIGDEPMSVHVVSFDVSESAAGNRLEWRLQMDNTAADIIIERSDDAKSWHAINKVGRSQSMVGFYIDQNGNEKNTYYRLRIEESDDKYVYSDVIGIMAASKKLNVYPTIILDKVYVESRNQDLNIKVSDMYGKIWLQTSSENQSGILTIGVDHLPKGNYFMIVNDTKDNNPQIIKLIKL